MIHITLCILVRKLFTHLDWGTDWEPETPNESGGLLQVTTVCLLIEALREGHCVAKSYAEISNDRLKFE